MSPPDGRSWGHFVVAVILHVVVFVAIGPLIGGVVVSVVVGIAQPGGIRGVFFGILAALSLSFLTLPAGYFLGWKAAFFTGLAVGAISAFVQRPVLIYALGIVVGTTVALILVPTSSQDRHVTSMIAVVLAGALSAAVCVRLTNWIRRQGLRDLAS
jgi:hypothetical protein